MTKLTAEFKELQHNIEERDELRFVVCLNQFFTSIQDDEKIKSERKLKIYDMITQLGNCEKEERKKYIRKIEKLL
ncbi:MAG: hypothetical protein ACK5LZ_03830 [Anaerorhabdus sp.]